MVKRNKGRIESGFPHPVRGRATGRDEGKLIKASIGNLEGDSMGKMLHLGVLITPNGAHNGAWRLPSSKPENGFKLNPYVDIAQTAERGKLDFLF